MKLHYNKPVYAIMPSVLSTLQCGPSAAYLADLLNLSEIDTTLLVETLKKCNREETAAEPAPDFKVPRRNPNCSKHTSVSYYMRG